MAYRPDTYRPALSVPTNLLAVPRPCANSDEFDKRFRRKLLRNVTLFRDTEGKLLPLIRDQDRTYGAAVTR